MIRTASQRVLRYQRLRRAVAAKRPRMERDRQPVRPMAVLVGEEQGLVAVQAVGLAVVDLEAVAVRAGQEAAVDLEVVMDQAVSKRM